MIESLDRHGIRASVLLNSDVCDRYPQIIEAGLARTGRGSRTARRTPSCTPDMSVDEERAILTDIVETIETATGQRPRGWMGPALTETFHTPALLAELGLTMYWTGPTTTSPTG